MDGLQPAGRGYRIREQGAEGQKVDIGEGIVQMATKVEIAFLMSHNPLIRAKEYVHSLRVLNLKSEITQRRGWVSYPRVITSTFSQHQF
jgi:hypothetical protein